MRVSNKVRIKDYERILMSVTIELINRNEFVETEYKGMSGRVADLYK